MSDSCGGKEIKEGADGNVVKYRFKIPRGCKYCIQNLRQIADRLETAESDEYLFVDPAPQLGRGLYHVYSEGLVLTEEEITQFERDFDIYWRKHR